jgi:protein TonB
MARPRPTARAAPEARRAAGPSRAERARGGTRLRWWPRRISTLQLALLVSFALHAALLSFRFVDPEGFKRTFKDTPLEVILVNARSNEPPTQAQAIAQASLAGGGEALSGRATSPLPPAFTVERGDAVEEARKRIEQMQREQQQLLATIRRELALLPPPDPRLEATGDPYERELQERRRQLLRVLAEIEKRINEENSRPKKRYISPATREAVYAVYYDSLRRKIEDRGTRDFPEANGRKIYGELTMNVTVVRSSGNKLLDARAIAIVRAAAPFGPFSEAMRREADLIVVTSRFRFTRDEGLATTLTAR